MANERSKYGVPSLDELIAEKRRARSGIVHQRTVCQGRVKKVSRRTQACIADIRAKVSQLTQKPIPSSKVYQELRELTGFAQSTTPPPPPTHTHT